MKKSTAGATLPAAAGTPLGSMMWTDSSGKTQVRVYYEASGALREEVYQGSAWGSGAMYIPVAASAAAQGEEVSATMMERVAASS